MQYPIKVMSIFSLLSQTPCSVWPLFNYLPHFCIISSPTHVIVMLRLHFKIWKTEQWIVSAKIIWNVVHILMLNYSTFLNVLLIILSIKMDLLMMILDKLYVLTHSALLLSLVATYITVSSCSFFLHLNFYYSTFYNMIVNSSVDAKQNN